MRVPRTLIIAATIVTISMGCAPQAPREKEKETVGVTNTVEVIKTVAVTNTVKVPQIVVVTNTVKEVKVVEVPVTNTVTRPAMPKPVPTIAASDATLAEASQVRIAVREGGGNARRVAGDAIRAVRNALSLVGYVVDGREPSDVDVTVSATCATFDKTGSWFVYEGELRLQTQIKGSKPRFMAEKVVRGKGKRGLGEEAAEQNLADRLVSDAGAWAKSSFSRESLGLKVVMVTLRIDERVKSTKELALQDAFCKAAEAEKGVRSVQIVRQNNAKGIFVFRVVFDEAQFSDGFLNTLLSKNPGWKLGYVK